MTGRRLNISTGLVGDGPFVIAIRSVCLVYDMVGKEEDPA
jgi:hypothetical protein